MKSEESTVSKKVSEKEQWGGLGPVFLEWGLWEDNPPTYKHLSDNLRAYLTIFAYLILLHYLWNWGPDKIPDWVFQSTAVIWGCWVGWFAILTLIQTWHLYLGFSRELLFLLIKPYAKNLDRKLTATEEELIKFLFLPFGLSCFVLVGGVFYLAGAMLRSAKLM